MINLILFGPPGSGKGTQATQLAEKYNLIHISTGDLFRYELGNNTPLGLKAKEYMSKGELVPDSVTMGMLRNKVESLPDAKGFIFDGVPRTTPQAEILDAMLEEKDSAVMALVALIVQEEEIVNRLLLRGTSSGRADDSDEAVIRKRIRVYENETTPVFDYYDKVGKSHKIDGLGTIEEIFDRLCTKIDAVSK
jgi:adenylate kinase